MRSAALLPWFYPTPVSLKRSPGLHGQAAGADRRCCAASVQEFFLFCWCYLHCSRRKCGFESLQSASEFRFLPRVFVALHRSMSKNAPVIFAFLLLLTCGPPTLSAGFRLAWLYLSGPSACFILIVHCYMQLSILHILCQTETALQEPILTRRFAEEDLRGS